MKLTKYVHSCLLVETETRTALFDPGSFSWQAGLFPLGALSRLDDILITHEHPDHMHLPFIQALRERFPACRITTTPAAAEQLQAAGLASVTSSASTDIELFAAAHESMAPLGNPPENTGFHYMNLLTHPGDSHHFDTTKTILALPVTAPWGTLAAAAALGQTLQPKYIVPIHDWHWNPEARKSAYERLKTFYKPLGITFLQPVDGQTLEVTI